MSATITTSLGKAVPALEIPKVSRTDAGAVSSTSFNSADVEQFRLALDRQVGMHADVTKSRKAGSNDSLGEKIVARTSHFASEIQKDQQYVSKLLEQATRTGDSMQLMKAMMALNDYQLRVQLISKTASKASTSIDQLTRLQ